MGVNAAFPGFLGINKFSLFSATAFVAAFRAGKFAFYGAVLYAFFGKGMLLLAGTASIDMQTLSFSKFHVVCI